jgi:hypothetical protein
MSGIRLTGVTIFLLFFGVATLEALQTRNWIKAAFWLAIGVVFLLADNVKSLRERRFENHTSRGIKG